MSEVVLLLFEPLLLSDSLLQTEDVNFLDLTICLLGLEESIPLSMLLLHFPLNVFKLLLVFL